MGDSIAVRLLLALCTDQKRLMLFLYLCTEPLGIRGTNCVTKLVRRQRFESELSYRVALLEDNSDIIGRQHRGPCALAQIPTTLLLQTVHILSRIKAHYVPGPGKPRSNSLCPSEMQTLPRLRCFLPFRGDVRSVVFGCVWVLHWFSTSPRDVWAFPSLKEAKSTTIGTLSDSRMPRCLTPTVVFMNCIGFASRERVCTLAFLA